MQTGCETPTLIDLPFRDPVEVHGKRVLLVCPIKIQSSTRSRAAKPEEVKSYTMSVERDMKSCTKLANLELISILLSDSVPESIAFKISDSSDSQSFSLNLRGSGCRITCLSLNTLGLSITMVQDVVAFESDVDRFIEEQDFLYNCMEIQEELLFQDAWDPTVYMSSTTSVPASSPGVPVAFSSGMPPAFDIEQEMDAMESLIRKYLPAKAVIPPR